MKRLIARMTTAAMILVRTSYACGDFILWQCTASLRVKMVLCHDIQSSVYVDILSRMLLSLQLERKQSYL